MSKAKYGKKVIKSLVRHRMCGTCSWWRRNRPNIPVRAHRCVKNHVGSAKLMECKSGVQGIKGGNTGRNFGRRWRYDYVGSCKVGLECNFEKAV